MSVTFSHTPLCIGLTTSTSTSTKIWSLNNNKIRRIVQVRGLLKISITMHSYTPKKTEGVKFDPLSRHEGVRADPLSLGEGVRLLTLSAWARGSGSWPPQLEWGGQPPDHLKLTQERLFCDSLTAYKIINCGGQLFMHDSQALHGTASVVASSHTSRFVREASVAIWFFRNTIEACCTNVRNVQ